MGVGDVVLKPDREQSLAQAALDLMGECGVIPTPDNFELFYAHATGEVSAVSHAIGEMLAQKKPFTPEILQGYLTAFVNADNDFNTARSDRKAASGNYNTANGTLAKWLEVVRLSIAQRFGNRWSTA